MSGYRLCQGKLADRPYFIRVIGANIWSIEELCFFFYHNPELLDDTIMEDGLCAWVRDELKEPELSRAMERSIRECSGIEAFVLPAFRRIGYLPHANLASYRRTLSELSRLPEHIRLKKKADALVRYGIEGGSLPVYEKALSMTDSDTPFAASVWYNMGVAHLYLFQYEEGAACFTRANAIEPSEKRNYARAAALMLAQENGGDLLSRSAADSLDEIPAELRDRVREQITAAGQSASLPAGDIDEWLAGLARAYHKSMEL